MSRQIVDSLLVTLCCIWGGCGDAGAQQMRVSPSVLFLTGETDERALLRVSTDTPDGLFVDAQLYERSSDGLLVQIASGFEEIALAPPQAFVPAGTGQSIYLQWRGATVREGRVFALFLDQIDPVRRADGVVVQVSLGTVIVVNPPQLPDQSVTLLFKKEESGFSVINTGPGVHVIGRGKIVATDAAGAVCVVTGESLLRSNTDTYVYPESRRHFVTNEPCIAGAARLSWRPYQ